MKHKTYPVKAKVEMKRGAHMGHQGKPVTIKPSHYMSKTVNKTKFPC